MYSLERKVTLMPNFFQLYFKDGRASITYRAIDNILNLEVDKKDSHGGGICLNFTPSDNFLKQLHEEIERAIIENNEKLK